MTSTPTAGALAGIRVLDISRILGGPYCGQILGDHGADVLKIEPPQGDDTRTWGPPFKDGVASYYMGLNRNKRVQHLDLSQDAGRERLLALLEQADVLVENFKIGTMERWGIGYDTLSRRFPRLIWCRVSGFGADGPLGGMAGYDAALQAMSGIMSVNGEAGGEPLRVGLPVVDMVTGLNAVIGVLLALQERHRSGKGQFVEATLYDSGLSLLHPHAANWFMDGRAPRRTGNAHPNIYPYDTFRTGTKPLFLAIGNDRQFATLCDVLELSGPGGRHSIRYAGRALDAPRRPEAIAGASAIRLRRRRPGRPPDGGQRAGRARAGYGCGADPSAHRAPRHGRSDRRGLPGAGSARQTEPHPGHLPPRPTDAGHGLRRGLITY